MGRHGAWGGRVMHTFAVGSWCPWRKHCLRSGGGAFTLLWRGEVGDVVACLPPVEQNKTEAAAWPSPQPGSSTGGQQGGRCWCCMG